MSDDTTFEAAFGSLFADTEILSHEDQIAVLSGALQEASVALIRQGVNVGLAKGSPKYADLLADWYLSLANLESLRVQLRAVRGG